MHLNKFLISNKKIIIVIGLLVGIIIVIIFNVYSLSKTTISNKSRASEISPTPIPPPCLQKEKGDANCDNFITETDRNIWREEYSQGKTIQLRADFNNNNLVNYDDYRIWFANWKK